MKIDGIESPRHFLNFRNFFKMKSRKMSVERERGNACLRNLFNLQYVPIVVIVGLSI